MCAWQISSLGKPMLILHCTAHELHGACQAPPRNPAREGVTMPRIWEIGAGAPGVTWANEAASRG